MNPVNGAPPPVPVVISADFLADDGTVAMGDLGFGRLAADPAIDLSYVRLAAVGGSAHDDDVLGRAQALLVMGEPIAAHLLDRAPRLRLVARFGVGVDAIDIAECTRRGIAVTTTPAGVRRPVASAALTMTLALAHNLPGKQRMAQAGHWELRPDAMGAGLGGRTVGVVGLGNIGQEFARLCAPFGARILAADPYGSTERAAALGVELAELDTVCRAADFLVVTCPLTPQTRHLIGRRELALLGPSGFLVNVSRGGIVDEPALVDALRDGTIRGAGLDTFEREPLPADSPLLSLENVIATPHALAITHELARGNGAEAVDNILRLVHGGPLRGLVNPVPWALAADGS